MASGTLPERVVIKIGTSSLITGGQPDRAKLAAVADAVAELRADGIQAVVIGSGAIAAGRARLAAAGTSADAAEPQLAAAVGQGLLFEAFRAAFEDRGLIAAQFLFTPLDLTGPEHGDSVRTALEAALDTGLVPVVNENDAVMVRNNDVLAALLAGSLRAARLLLLTDVPGLYESDPRRNAGARRIPEIAVMTPEVERLAGVAARGLGTGGMPAKLCAAWIATFAGVPVVIAGSDTEDAVVRAVRGEAIGTLVHPRVPEKEPDLGRLWRSFSAPPSGRLLCCSETASVVAGGGVLTTQHIRGHEGDFPAGAVVDVTDADWRVVVRGRTRLSSADLIELTHAGTGPAVLDHTDYVSLQEA
ncbi:glutamate 5-kinase [Streptomyces sp. NPDC002104]